MRPARFLLGAVVAVGLLGGCGVKGDPQLPEGVKDMPPRYPHTYPKAERPWLEDTEVPSVLPPPEGTSPYEDQTGTTP